MQYKFHTYFSLYVALAVWGTAGFMAQPTLASFLVHFALTPVLLFLLILIAHWEGRSHVRAQAQTSVEQAEQRAATAEQRVAFLEHGTTTQAPTH
jgi:hypothetical protein